MDGMGSRVGNVTTMTEFYLDDARWALIASSLPGKRGDPGRHGRDNRMFMEAVLWVVRTGSSWRKLPPQFGHWYTAFARFHRWTLKNVWPGVFAKLAQDPDCEYFYENGAILYAPSGQRRACQGRRWSRPQRSVGDRLRLAPSRMRLDVR